jgi:hypothetical protein
MTTVDFITALFYEVDEQLGAIPKHPREHQKAGANVSYQGYKG